LLILLLLPLLLLAMMPLVLLQRYRAGTARRQARPWIATLTLVGISFSALCFLVGAAVTTVWVPGALHSAAAGLGSGCLLGVFGLVVTRWEATPRSLHYTPNKWLVLIITVVVSARVLYGLWRSWAVAQASFDDAMVAEFGVPASLAAGATVLGYYLAYAAGVRWRIYRWQHRPLRVI
jgi:hypothetical protein